MITIIIHALDTLGYSICYGLFVSPPKSYLKSQIPRVIIFGDKGAKEVMKVKEVLRVGSDPTGLVSF